MLVEPCRSWLQRFELESFAGRVPHWVEKKLLQSKKGQEVAERGSYSVAGACIR